MCVFVRARARACVYLFVRVFVRARTCVVSIECFGPEGKFR